MSYFGIILNFVIASLNSARYFKKKIYQIFLFLKKSKFHLDQVNFRPSLTLLCISTVRFITQ